MTHGQQLRLSPVASPHLCSGLSLRNPQGAKTTRKKEESNSRTLPLPRHTIIDVGTIHEKTFFKSSIEKTQCFESYIFKIDNEILKIAFSSYSSLSLSRVLKYFALHTWFTTYKQVPCLCSLVLS